MAEATVINAAAIATTQAWWLHNRTSLLTADISMERTRPAVEALRIGARWLRPTGPPPLRDCVPTFSFPEIQQIQSGFLMFHRRFCGQETRVNIM
ncbi:MAG: hypothetical protein K2Z80_01415 [Xanthobacteraceae bacterium]|nr:hypothetical protein [Xanthobacteraceae bacterium]